jgi:hypothetical protein
MRARFATALSRAGAWAMRPQTAMAAVFLLVIGTSFVLVETRKSSQMPGAAASMAEGTPVQAAGAYPATASALAFDEKETAFAHGVEEKRAADPRAPTTLPKEMTADGDLRNGEQRDDKAKDGLAKNERERITNAGPIGGVDLTTATTRGLTEANANAPAGGGGGSTGALAQAHGTFTTPPIAVQQQGQGQPSQTQPGYGNTEATKSAAPSCTTLVAQYEADRSRGAVGNDVTLNAARCYRSLGRIDEARARYSSLLSTSYASVAQNELDAMSPALAARKAQQQAPRAQVQASPPAATATAAPQQQQKATASDRSSY